MASLTFPFIWIWKFHPYLKASASHSRDEFRFDTEWQGNLTTQALNSPYKLDWNFAWHSCKARSAATYRFYSCHDSSTGHSVVDWPLFETSNNISAQPTRYFIPRNHSKFYLKVTTSLEVHQVFKNEKSHYS